MLAICTPACGRPQLTRTTLSSFMKHNPRAQAMVRLMAVDHCTAIDDEANLFAAAEFGWNPIAVGMPSRSGLMWGMRELVHAAIARGCTQMLWLENDWECVAPLNVPGITHDVDCVRLYGLQKQQDGARPSGALNMVTGMIIPWQDCGEYGGQRWQSAKAHFGGAPSIVDLRCVAPFVDRPTMKDMAKAMGELRTVRPSQNFFWHIGLESTSGFKH